MKKEFVTYQQALRLKALEFDEPCMLFFSKELNMSIWLGLDERSVTINKEKEDEDFLIPTFSQAFRWFRDKNYHVNIDSFHCIGKPKPYGLSIDYLHESGKWGYIDYRDDNDFETYEEAQSKAIDVIIEILENKYDSI